MPILMENYGADTEIDEESAAAGNPEYIELMDERLHRRQRAADGRPRPDGRRDPSRLETAGETGLPTVEEFLDSSYLEEAHKLS